MGILDNDFKAAFDFMTLDWVFKVLKAKGLDQTAIDTLERLYSNNLTVVVVNNIPGRSIRNNYMSIRQGDRPSSTLFCFGIDPHITWLERRLSGILIYKQAALGPLLPGAIFQPQVEARYKVLGYIDDIKPAVTSMNEFKIIDRGAAIFEAASGCILHRDPMSNKVKLLPLGRWKDSLQQEDLPVRYIAISEHLDMVGVQLKSTYTQTRKVNGDILQEKVSKKTGSWKGGKFMSLSLRSHSLNTYCLSQVWFKCGSINLREGDVSKINSALKSWLFADLLVKPGEVALYRPRKQGGLGLLSVKYKAMAVFIRSFMETAIDNKFIINPYHNALYKHYIEENRVVPIPPRCPYLSEEIINNIKEVKNESILNISTLSSGGWYKVLVENNITTTLDDQGRRTLKQCKAEINHPHVNWEVSWRRAALNGLSSEDHSFLWKLLHNILPTQERQHRLGINNTVSPNCNRCDQEEVDEPCHALITCSQNNEVSNWLLQRVQPLVPGLTPQQLVLLNLGDLPEEQNLPVTWLIAKTLNYIWSQRCRQKKPTLHETRATLEAEILILRKSRYQESSRILDDIIGR